MHGTLMNTPLAVAGQTAIILILLKRK